MYKLNIKGKVLPDGKAQNLVVALAHERNGEFASFSVKYNIECIDEAGNTIDTVSTETSFEITDESALGTFTDALVRAGRIGNWETTIKILQIFCKHYGHTNIRTDINWKNNVDIEIRKFAKAA